MTEPLPFWKMSGAGNDFIVLEAITRPRPILDSGTIRDLCARGTSIGADGVILLLPPEEIGRVAPLPDIHPTIRPTIQMQHWNADGGENDYCGNGTRCAARFAFEHRFAGRDFVLQTAAGNFEAHVLEDGHVRVAAPGRNGGSRLCELTLTGEAQPVWGCYAVVGVPHFIVEVGNVGSVDVAGVGSRLRSHPDLGAAGANVDFVALRPDGSIDIRTFERGVEAETLSCGSGAVAAALWLSDRVGAQPVVTLHTRSGVDLRVERENVADQPGRAMNAREVIWLIGEARIVFTGLTTPETTPGTMTAI